MVLIFEKFVSWMKSTPKNNEDCNEDTSTKRSSAEDLVILDKKINDLAEDIDKLSATIKDIEDRMETTQAAVRDVLDAEERLGELVQQICAEDALLKQKRKEENI